MKKLILAVVIMMLLMGRTSFGQYQESNYLPIYSGEALRLFNLGLYKGISPSEFKPDLASYLNRETAIVMLMRVLGLEEKSLQMGEVEAENCLKRFSDGKEVSDWARKQVAFAVKRAMVKGYPDLTIKPREKVTSGMYCSMLLNELGYKFSYRNASSYLSSLVGAGGEPRFVEEGPIRKDAMIGISFYSLRCKYVEDGRTLLQKLVDEGRVEKGKAFEKIPESTK